MFRNHDSSYRCNAGLVRCVLAIGLFAVPACDTSAVAQEIGKRPYEMEWAGRTRDTRPPLIDFEDLSGWTVDCRQAVASFVQSRQQQLWGKYVGKLVYLATGTNPTLTLRPPKPVPVTGPFDCVNIWIYGNNWGWSPDRTTPPVAISVLLQRPGGQVVSISLGSVRWKEWWLMHRRLTEQQIAELGPKTRVVGIEIRKGTNKDNRTLFFDNLAVYKEALPPLTFQPRRERGITLPAGQTVGTNTGPGRLPFPNRAETILPTNLTAGYRLRIEPVQGGYAFHYEGDDGHLVYRYTPKTGTLSDVSAEWIGRGRPFMPLSDGGIRFWDDSGATDPEKIELIDCRRDGELVVSKWRCTLKARVAEVTYSFRLWQKSLVIDVACRTREIGEFRIGKVVGSTDPRLVTIPYLVGDSQRPAVLIAGPKETPLFVLPLVDHCRSNASLLWFANDVAKDGVTQNGGSRYLPRTDGQRNPCFERLFLTVSPRLEEVLPNIPNPKSPWMHVAGERLWRAHGASNRQSDLALWEKCARFGMNKTLITDHETGWRDGGESFTMRTRAAPGKGGDAAQQDYARKLHALGFRYGIYNNYTDYAPVNEYWNEDYVSRLPDNQWRTAWPRCYNVKPARAVELEAKLAPIIQKKFHLDTAYCDVHTAVRPWSYCDFDARVPGAGTFAATFYAYGEIMLHQKATWNGPVYSEGNNHWYYCGLTDGNYGQDQSARLNVNPWLVDFDLLKLHPKCCNFGMGNPGMFYGRKPRTDRTQTERLDRFLAATLAFGHTGFLVREGGFENAFRSYYSVQQIHTRYAQQTVSSIRYAGPDGRLWPTSAALASGLYRRSQVVSRYSDGLEVWVNGNATETWTTPKAVIPPNGWLVCDPREKKLTAFSAMIDGHRADYVESPAYIYANGRGRVTRFQKATADGQMVALPRKSGAVELIPVGSGSVFGVSMGGKTATAVALDQDRKMIGPADTRLSRGVVYVTPVKDAVSYLLRPESVPARPMEAKRVVVLPGEKVPLTGSRSGSVQIPNDAPVGRQWWYREGDQSIDFTVQPLATTSLRIDKSLKLHLIPHVATPTHARLQFGETFLQVELQPEQPMTLAFPVPKAEQERVDRLPLAITADPFSLQQQWWLKFEYDLPIIRVLDKKCSTGQCLRGKQQRSLDSRTKAAVYWTERACGSKSRPCLFMHPPYGAGTGYSYALFDTIQLPVAPKAMLRCDVGKADGSDPGDGILFRIVIVEDQDTETMVAQQQLVDHCWKHLAADLSRWAGKRVRIKLIADVGKKDNSSGDWACWSKMRIEGVRPILVPSIHDQAVELARTPGPLLCEGLTIERARKAKTAILHFQGIGLQHGKPFISFAKLNDLLIGELPAATGNEQQGKWADAALTLSADTIGRLTEWNQLVLDNPNRDSFKVRRFWVELQWEDGSRASSNIANTVYTQPGTWLYAEGTGVPFSQSISIPIRLPMK